MANEQSRNRNGLYKEIPEPVMREYKKKSKGWSQTEYLDGLQRLSADYDPPTWR